MKDLCQFNSRPADDGPHVHNEQTFAQPCPVCTDEEGLRHLERPSIEEVRAAMNRPGFTCADPPPPVGTITDDELFGFGLNPLDEEHYEHGGEA